MEFRADKAYFKSDTLDAYSKLPIYVFDSTYLPNLSQSSYDKNTQDQIILKAFKRVMRRIPNHPHILVCFTSGFKNLGNQMHSWVTMLKCYQLLPNEFKSNLKKIYMVHESWLVRSFTQVLTNVLNIKAFKKSITDGKNQDKIIYCNNITELSKSIDITKIRISLEVYLFDLQFTEKLIIPYSANPGSKDYQEYKELIMNRTISRLLIEANDYELVLTKPGNQTRLRILIDAIDRMNYLDLSQWDIYVVGTLFLHTLRNYKTTLIPIDLIRLPLKNDTNYTLRVFKDILDVNGNFDIISKIIEFVILLLKSSTKTKHDLKTISKTLAPSLCQEKVSLKNNDRLIVGQAYIKNLIENWDEISRNLSQNNVKSITTTKVIPKQPKAPAPRNVSFSKGQPVVFVREVNEAKPLPKIPLGSGTDKPVSSDINIDSEESSRVTTSEYQESPIIIQRDSPINVKEEEGVKVLNDATSSLNKTQAPTLKPPHKAATKFSDGYSSIEGKRKVTKLAQLYEERLKGLKVLDQIDAGN